MKLLRLDVLIEDMATQKGLPAQDIREELAAHLDISERRLKQYRSAEIGDGVTIPLAQLADIAKFFSCKVDELYNSSAIEVK